MVRIARSTAFYSIMAVLILSAVQIYLTDNMADGAISDPTSDLITRSEQDETPPILEINYPVNNYITNSSEISIIWTAEDLESGIIDNQVRMIPEPWLSTGMNTSINISGLDDGYYSLDVRVENGVGLWSYVTVKFTVDTTPPSLNLRMDDPFATSEDSVNIKYNGEDHTTDIVGYYVKVDGGEWIDNGIDESYKMDISGEGEHLIYVKGIDWAGNERVISGSIIYDRTAPLLNVTWPLDGSHHSDNYIIIRWTSEDELTEIDHFELIIDEDKLIETDLFYHVLNYLDEGEHEIEIVSIDTVGNMNDERVVFTVDMIPPQVTDYHPKGVITDPNNPVFIDFSEKIAEEGMMINISGVNGTTYSYGERWFLSRSVPFEYGVTYNVTVSAHDLAGNPLVPFSWDFTLSDMGEIAGIVVDWWGNPLSGADIYIDGERVDRTDIDGTYHFTYQMGTYEIVVTRFGYQHYTGIVTVEPGVNRNVGQSMMKRNEGDDDGLSPLLILVIVLLVIIVLAAGIAISVMILRREVEKRNLISMDDREAMIDILKNFGIRTRLDQIDCYDTLGLDTDANKKEIRSAYRRLAKRYHPDLMNSYGEDWEEIENKMREINAAKEILTDPTKKEIHDRILKAYGK